MTLKCIRHAQCVRTVYKDMLCRKHFMDYLKASLRSLFKSTYRDPGRAYSSVDPDGKGFITREDFLSCAVIKRLCVKSVTLQDIQELISRENMFKVPSSATQKKLSPQKYWETPQMDFEDFRRTFFPQYF